MCTVTVLPPIDPAKVRVEEGFHPAASWYSPRQIRPAAFKALDGTPASDVREERSE